jgi:hypothetical protein
MHDASNKVRSELERFVSEFTNIRLKDRRINCPFWMNKDPFYKGTGYYKYFAKGGKRSAKEIEKLIAKKAALQKLDLGKASDYELNLFFLRNGIGVDCSGFVYQCLRQVYRTLGGRGFDKKVSNSRTGDKGIRRVGVLDLASSQNSRRVEKLDEIRPGDFIIAGASHSVIIIRKFPGFLEVAHANNAIREAGVHRFRIKITDPKGQIFDQEWQETSYDGLPYLESLKRKLKRRDGVRRLKIIERLYNG